MSLQRTALPPNFLKLNRILPLVALCLFFTHGSAAQTPGTANIIVTSPMTRPTGSSAARISITVNGVTAYSLTSEGESFGQIAQDIAQSFSNSGVPVTAIATSDSVQLTATTDGVATNYSLSCSVQAPYVPTFALTCPAALSGGTGYTPEVGYIHPKFTIVGVTYAPPGPSSFVQYTDSTAVGSTTTHASSFTSNVSLSVSVQGTISAWVILGGAVKVTASESNSYTQASTNSTTVTINKTASVTDKTTGTANAFSPIDHDYDIIWLWLNPLLIYTASGDPTSPTSPISLQWNGYGYDQADQPEIDVYGVYVGYLNGHFGDNPSADAVLARSWSTGLIWPTGDGPAINANDKLNILAADPFSNSSYTLPSPLTPETPDDRFTIVPGISNFDYEQAGLDNGAGITQQYNLTNSNSTATTNGSTYTYQQSFGLDESVTTGANFYVFKAAVTVDMKESGSLTWTHSSQTTGTTVNTLMDALSITGPGCPATTAPCNPLYSGPGEFDAYQDNLFGTFMFAPVN